MEELKIILGKRIRNYRRSLNMSQEQLAEKASCHHTYIGQVERGEKNVTIEVVEKIAQALNVEISQLFEKIFSDKETISYPLLSYELFSGKSIKEQEKLYKLLLEIEEYKEN